MTYGGMRAVRLARPRQLALGHFSFQFLIGGDELGRTVCDVRFQPLIQLSISDVRSAIPHISPMLCQIAMNRTVSSKMTQPACSSQRQLLPSERRRQTAAEDAAQEVVAATTTVAG